VKIDKTPILPLSPHDPDLTHFKCLGCGACCRQSGYVRLRPHEPDLIARYLGKDVDAFIQTHTRLTRDRQALSLLDKADGSCMFLTDKGCEINPVKPAQCRDFPIGWRFNAFTRICAWARGVVSKQSGPGDR